MSVKPETIIRTICLVIALINQVLAIYGKEKIPVTDDEVYQLVSIFFTVATSLWAWWKNNSYTVEAIAADKYLEDLRSKKEG